MKKKILVFGYKKLNLGDDLFFSILFSRYPDVKFIFPGTKKYKNVFKKHKNVKVVSPYSVFDLFISIIDKLRKEKQSILEKIVDYKVLITGSAFAEQKNLNNNNSDAKNLFIISANFGPYQTNEFLESKKNFFSNCNDVCFRDSQSYKLFSMLQNTRYAPDVVFDINTYYKNLEKDSAFLRNIGLISQKYAVISVLSFKTRAGGKELQQNYIEGIKKISAFLISKGLKIVFMSFCEMENDHDTIEHLLQNENIVNYSYEYTYNGDISEALTIIKNADSVIATRFHSMVLGLTMGKKVLPIVYNLKMSNVIEDLQLEYSITAKSLCEIEEVFLENWYNNFKFNDAEIIATESKRQFKKLDSVLKD